MKTKLITLALTLWALSGCDRAKTCERIEYLGMMPNERVEYLIDKMANKVDTVPKKCEEK